MLYPRRCIDLYRVNDVYKESKTQNIPLLSNFPAVFWQNYRDNYTRYDRIFNRLYRSFKIFEQDPLKEVDEILDEFTENVYDHLLIHQKKYEELYRINVIPDDSYSVIDNYDITETLEKTTLDDVESVSGSRTDSITKNMGEKIDSRTLTEGAKTDNKSTTHGAIQKTGSETLGAIQKSGSETVGAIQKSKTETLGAREDSSSYSQGAQNNSSTEKVAPDDSENFYNNRNVLDSIGNRNDSTLTNTGSQSNSTSENVGAQTNSTSENIGAQSNSSSENIGSYTDTEEISQGARTTTDSVTEGAHTDSESATKGAQTDTKSATGSEEYTLRRKGNIGVMTSTDVMKKASEFWTEWDFYSYIFGEIAKELLIV